MPVHNGQVYLAEAVDSILRQSFSDFELIVVNDASTDQTASILDGIRDARLVRLTNESQLGVAASLNRGLAESRGRLIARMDADDLSVDSRLQRQVDFMQTHPSVVLCGSEAERIDAQGQHLRDIKRLHHNIEIRWHLLSANPFIHPSVIFRADAVKRVGGYDPNLRCAQDYDLWCRLALEGECANLPERLVRYRLHANAISATKRSEQMRVTRQKSMAHLVDSGVAGCQDQSELFLAFAARSGEPHRIWDYPRPQWNQFPEMVDRFFHCFDDPADDATAACRRCRQTIRRMVLRHVNHVGLNWGAAYQLFRLARRVDPEGMGMRQITSRSLRRALRRLPLRGSHKGNKAASLDEFASRHDPSRMVI
ncbi:Putative glycosyltransferase EpsE [Stieleria maiorica]|uniref:Glycosyltransferase EpsE n=1 Tax=Stieleria maiorica TaxID=2795974 RepID=A0A5B9MJ21_9BACT|nr:glycosyltransferase [Stieleria maiorica]QEF99644.1 Putative glycosyltransferase EpsE [Stieleria maiorica]